MTTTEPTDSAIPTVVEAARALAPLILAHADSIEAERRLPEPVVQGLTEAGVFRLYVPRALGGAEADPVTVCRVVEELAEADGATGWCAMVGATFSLFGGLLPDQAAREIYGDPSVAVAGSFRPGGTARIVEGGYLVSGRWSFGSGITHSDWVFGACRVFDGDAPRLTASGAPELRLLFFPQSEAEIIDTWDVGGLRGTGSHDHAIADLFVPVHRTCRFSEEPVQPGPLYSLPPIMLCIAPMAAVAIGIARHALDALKELAGAKTPARSQNRLREHPLAQFQVGQAEGLLRAGRAFLYESLAAAWDAAQRGQRLTWEQRGLVWLATTQAVDLAVQVVDLVFRAGGGSSVYASLPIERCLRDLHTLAQHHSVAVHNYEVAGQLFMGFEMAGSHWGRDYRGDAPSAVQ
jgi:indole-3-acetate monooxygenase